MRIPWALSFRQRFPPRGCSEMTAYSVQRAGHESETHRFCADLRQCGIHHTHGQAEHCDFARGIPQAVPFKTSNGRKQDCDHTEDQSMGITQSRLTKEVSQETTGDKGQDGYCRGQRGLKIALSAL
jgi:hypothetical protein